MDRVAEYQTHSFSVTPCTPTTASTPLPPGPSGLPLVGSMMSWEGPSTNLAWTKQFGDIYQVKMGPKTLVYLNSVDLVEKYMEGSAGEKFLDRPMGPAAIAQGLLFGSGETWKSNKKAFMTALHTHTLQEHTEAAIQAELTIAMDSLLAQCGGEPCKIGDVMLQACAGAVAGLLLGRSLPRDSPDRKELLEVVKSLEGVDLNSVLTIIAIKHPKLREPLNKLLFKDIVDFHGISERLQILLRSWIKQARRETLNTSQAPYIYVMSDRAAKCEKRNPKSLRIKIPSRDSSPVIYDGDQKNTCEDVVSFFSEFASVASVCSPECPPICPSEDSILSPPHRYEELHKFMRHSTHISKFVFPEVAPGELPMEEPEDVKVGECPKKPLTESQWKFDRQMSINPQEDSILKRILNQPEFANLTEHNDAELLQSLMDMFFGGVTSTLAGQEYTLMYLTQHPVLQQAAQAEIDEVVETSQDGEITFSDRDRMPYVRACITEALRLGVVTPSSLPHIATENTEIEGYTVPKGTMVIASIYSLHYDPRHYLDPQAFRPHRHLCSEEGKLQGKFQAPKSYRPYGVGARRCVGDKVSEMQLFLYTTHILRRFTLTPSKEGVNTDTHMRIVHRLKDFKCVLHRRDIS